MSLLAALTLLAALSLGAGRASGSGASVALRASRSGGAGLAFAPARPSGQPVPRSSTTSADQAASRSIGRSRAGAAGLRPRGGVPELVNRAGSGAEGGAS